MDKITQGERAGELLINPVFQEAIQGVKDAIHEQWEKCPIRDVEGQQYLKLELKILNDLVGNIRSMVNSGKMEAHKKTVGQKVRQFVRS